MNITLKQLRYFIALAEVGNFGRAAEAMHVTQPALSVQIKELEGQVGSQLVERQPRGLVLTPAGHDLLRHARQVMAEMQQLEQSARWQRGLGGKLTLGVIPTVAPYLLPEALPLLRMSNVTLELGVREAQTDILLAALSQGRLDAAIVALPTGEDGLFEAPLFQDRFLLAGTDRMLTAVGDRLQPAGLNPDRLLLLDEGHCLADQALEVCALKREQTRVDLGASSLATLCGLVAQGFGMTFLPELALASEQAASPDLCLRRFQGAEPHRTIGLVRRRLSQDDGWFADLAALLREAGQGLIEKARRALPPDA
ncbi:LysR substrate-binding domain-containing protein [Actibacterium sp.]|uniref:LysR substrate-binding domain-containing protein n=1 Tax=Actibacterium sp. TaxID=1872125 RepID=UPI0035630ACD